MSEQEPRPPDAEMVRVLRAEVEEFIRHLTGDLRRVSVQAPGFAIEVEWESRSTPTEPKAPDAAPPRAAETDPADMVDGDATVDFIVAPLVGTFYRAPEPGAEPFVKAGDLVEAGQPVGVIEAMKLMNAVGSHRRGVVREVLVEDGEMVEFQQPLVRLGPMDIPDSADHKPA